MKKNVLLLVLTLLPVVANADPVKIDGISYNLDTENKVAEVTVSDNWEGYTGDIMIPDTVEFDEVAYRVTSIGFTAFRWSGKLSSVTLPNTITYIGEGAFAYCSSLTSIIIPDAVTSIEAQTFQGCSSLTSVEMGTSVLSIKDRAFDGCKSLASIEIPESVTTIGSGAFDRCSSLVTVSIPNSVTEIQYDAFQYCTGLTTVTLSEKLETISRGLFIGCSSLTTVNIPSSVKTIEPTAFYLCRSLTSIIIPDGVTTIGNQAFEYCDNLASITIPQSVSSIGASSFRNCPELAAVMVDAANPIYDSRDNCNAIIETATNKLIAGCMSTTIPSDIKMIGAYAFAGSKLTAASIPSSVDSIAPRAFQSCPLLASVQVEEGNRKYDSREGCNAIIETATNTLLYGCLNTIIPSSVSSVYDYAFFGSKVSTVNIPEGVLSIGKGLSESA